MKAFFPWAAFLPLAFRAQALIKVTYRRRSIIHHLHSIPNQFNQRLVDNFVQLVQQEEGDPAQALIGDLPTKDGYVFR